MTHFRMHLSDLASKRSAIGQIGFWLSDTFFITLITASLWFFVPLATGCTPCPEDPTIENNHRLLAGGAASLYDYSSMNISYSCHDESLNIRNFNCPEAEWNQMATLTLNGQ